MRTLLVHSALSSQVLPDPALSKSYAAQSSIGTLIAWADDQSQRGEGRRQEIVSAKSEIWLGDLDSNQD